jgi:signal transduction histidine kinase
MLSRLCFTVVLLLCVLFTQVQQNFTPDDSLLFKKADSAFSLAFKQADTALGIAKSILALNNSIKNREVMANAWNAAGWAYMHKGFLDSSAVALQKAWQLFSEAESYDNIVRVSINLAEVYTKQNQISVALQYLLGADSLCIKTGNKPFHTNVKRQMAIVYRESGDYQKSAEYFRQALEGFAEQKDYFRYANTGISLSILYRNRNMPDSSLYILRQCEALIKQKSNMPYQVAMVNEHLGDTYFGLKQYRKALDNYSTAYSIFEAQNNKADLAFESLNLGKTYIQLNRATDAEQYLLRGYHLSDTLKMINYQMDAALQLAELYKKTADWEKAYSYLQKAAAFKDSLNVAEQVTQANALKEKFETVKKENEIALLKTQNQLAELNNRKTRLLQYIFIILFAASLIIGWLLLNRFRIKRRLHDQLLRNQIARDLHDDIGSALSSIDISSGVALVKKDDADKVTEQLHKIQLYARKTMDSMSDIVWSINPQNDSFENILSRMREFAAELCEPLNIELVFKAEGDTGRVIMETGRRKNLFLIFKEAVNNAVKYSACKKITVSLAKKNDWLELVVADDGKGFDENAAKKGNGLLNMRARAADLGGKMEIISSAEKGTALMLRCPV